MTNLRETIQLLSQLSGDLTIYARRPWGADSEVLLAPEPEPGGLPDEARSRGMEYLIEVFVAREFLDGWVRAQAIEATVDQQCERLVDYAENDA